jgi:hypothetical protein
MELDAEMIDKVDRAVTLARVEWDRTSLQAATPTLLTNNTNTNNKAMATCSRPVAK